MRHRFSFAWMITAGLLLAFLADRAVSGAEPAPVNYEREVAPILRAYCAGCHNDEKREAGLSVETFAQFKTGGEDHPSPLSASDPEEAFLLRSIEGRSRPHMPPKDEPQMPPRERELLRRWLAEGVRGPTQDVSILTTLIVPKLPAAQTPVPILAVAWSRDGKHRVRTRANHVELFTAEPDSAPRWVAQVPGRGNAVQFSPDGRWVVVASGTDGLTGTASLLDASNGSWIREFGRHRDQLFDAEFSPDGTRLATAGYDRVIRLWRVADGTLERSIDIHKGAVFDLAWHPDGRVLASASADETVKLWRVSDGLRLDTLNQPQGELYRVIFSPDGSTIFAAGADRRIHAWSFSSGENPGLNPVRHSRFAHETAILGMVQSPDGRRLVTVAKDRAMKIWSAGDLELLEAREPTRDLVTALAERPGHGMFTVAGMEGSQADLPWETVGTSSTRPVVLATDARPQPATGTSVSTPALAPHQVSELEPNDQSANAQPLPIPGEARGTISRPQDADLYRVTARAGVPLWLEIRSARDGGRLDSRLEVLHPDGRGVEQVVLQATRDSWFTFRGKDSDTPDDFRVHNWAEMELNEYLYAGGEVVRLWLYPRGPDSGFKVYPGSGKRHGYFSTTPLVHALGAPCYIVSPLPPGSQPAPNGLPVFRLLFTNDDECTRRYGADSALIFEAPADGDYLVRVTDVRGFGGPEKFEYTLTARAPAPDFEVTSSPTGLKVSPGSGREVSFRAERREGFTGPIRIDVTGLPPGFTWSGPVEIEAGQFAAVGVVYADRDAQDPGPELDKAIKVTASADIAGSRKEHVLAGLGDLQVAPAPKVTVEILPSEDRRHVREEAGQPLEFSIRPGETITARVRAVRHDFTGRIELGGEDSGRNLPHGVYVDNIGLNGLLIVEGQTEREFFITASKIVRPGVRSFHLRANADDGQASQTVRLRILPAQQVAARGAAVAN